MRGDLFFSKDRCWQAPFTQRLGAAIGVLTIVCLIGCGGDDWQAVTYPARGTILINGQAPVGAVVELRAAAESPDVRNSRPWAIVQADGSYELSTYERGDGAPAGDYKLTVRWPPDVNQPSMADRLAGAYANAKKSPWTVTVRAADNTLPPIEITGARVASAANAPTPRQAPPGPGMAR